MSDSNILPPQIKTRFLPNKSLPNLDDYDVIGFDVDHTLVKYKVANHVRSMVKCALNIAH